MSPQTAQNSMDVSRELGGDSDVGVEDGVGNGLLALLRRLSEIGAQGLVSLGAVEIQESLDW